MYENYKNKVARALYVKEYNKKYVLLNKEKVKKYRKLWAKNHRDIMNEAGRRWYKNHPEYEQKRKISPRYRFRRYKKSAKERGYEFKLTFEQFVILISGKCHYCGIDGKMGVDRKDNKIGYLQKNCASCCWECNEFKGRRSYEIFVNKIKRYLNCPL